MGANIMLAHFHYVNKGKHPFAMALNESGLREVTDSANLSVEQTEFVRESAHLAQSRGISMATSHKNIC